MTHNSSFLGSSGLNANGKFMIRACCKINLMWRAIFESSKKASTGGQRRGEEFFPILSTAYLTVNRNAARAVLSIYRAHAYAKGRVEMCI